jgi:CDP-paratose 2-epimerase
MKMDTPYKKILVTGGCGFVGSSIAFRLKRDGIAAEVICLDNLKRRGSELNLPRLKAAGIEFRHGDIRVAEDLEAVGRFDLLIECSAEPSVLAGFGESPAYLIQTNLMGTCNCLELVRRQGAALIFLSTSRVYPFGQIDQLAYMETETRYELAARQLLPGAGSEGISEEFPLSGPRSMYGATKLASELLIHEYAAMYGIPAVINRCGLLTGPWQFGKVDQGVIVLWVARHFWKQPLSYIGYGGAGKQVRDLLHVDDFYALLRLQLGHMDACCGEVFNVGGGRERSLSLLELTELCARITGNRVQIAQVSENRPADVRSYITDNRKVSRSTGWKPRIGTEAILMEIYEWIRHNQAQLEAVLT